MLEGKVYRMLGVDPATSINLFEPKPRYRSLSPTVEVVFTPANCIDRTIRKDYWTTMENRLGRKWKNPTATFTLREELRDHLHRPN